MEQPMEKNDFVDMVYDKMIDQLVGVILRWAGRARGRGREQNGTVHVCTRGARRRPERVGC